MVLDNVSIRVMVVHTSCWSVIDTPERHDVVHLALEVCQSQLVQVVVREGDMLQSRRVFVFVLKVWHPYQRDAVMLINAGHERERIILVVCVCSEKDFIPVVHFGKIVGAKDNMSQFRR